VTGVSAGTVWIIARFAGDDNYCASEQKSKLTVLQGECTITPDITLTVSPTTLNIGDTATLSVSGQPSGSTITYKVVSGPGTISGNILKATGSGTIKVQATSSSVDKYCSATSSTKNITVNEAACESSLELQTTSFTYNCSN